MQNQFIVKLFVNLLVPILICIQTPFNIIGFIFSWLGPRCLLWNRYSEEMLRNAERKILQVLTTKYRGSYVDIGPTVGKADKIWTISLNVEAGRTPLVLLHGLGAGVALWCLNLDVLASNRPVYALDLLGFGRSSRPDFDPDAAATEHQFVRSIEEWRKEMQLESFICLGHSMGAFLAASYAFSHPDRVKHLIFADPWGFPERPPDFRGLPLWVRTVSYAMQTFNPLTIVRVAGPLGPRLIGTLRPDLSRKFSGVIDDPDLIPEYIYQCNCQKPSGETAFHNMMFNFDWAKNPIAPRINQLRNDIPVTLIYGSRSWVNHWASDIIKSIKPLYFKARTISGAGHHVYADRPETFNQIVADACTFTDQIDREALLNSPIIDADDELSGSDRSA